MKWDMEKNSLKSKKERRGEEQNSDETSRKDIVIWYIYLQLYHNCISGNGLNNLKKMERFSDWIKTVGFTVYKEIQLNMRH